MADNIEGRAATSSCGPTNLGCARVQQRIKPDVLAPTTFIMSARSRNAKGEMWKQQVWAENMDEDLVYVGGFKSSNGVGQRVYCSRSRKLNSRLYRRAKCCTFKAALVSGAALLNGQYTS